MTILDRLRSLELVAIRAGIKAELQTSAKGIPFKVLRVECIGGVIALIVLSDSARFGLDESMEDGTVGWRGQSAGTAEILSIDTERSSINAIALSGCRPVPGQTIWVNPPRYLEPLLALWQRDDLARVAVAWQDNLRRNAYGENFVLDSSCFSDLRPAQRRAFQLPDWRIGYLWGPPGTGKTRTIARLLAAYIASRPSDRVLVMSTTNTAVDQVLLEVDKALRSLTAVTANGACMRFGSRFEPKRYEDREYLIPVRDKQLVRDYHKHMMSAPDPAEVCAHHAWKQKLEDLRELIRRENRRFLSSTRVAAMTATYAIFQYEELCACAPYDLVVFDEASQVGLAHAMILVGLGRRVLFAGDPNQLSPIVQSDDSFAQAWLGRSAFEWMSLATGASVMLDEQWRMAPDICRVVSHLFYKDQLRVAEPAIRDPKWLAARTVNSSPLLGASHVSVLSVQAEAQVAPRFRGYTCPESANLVAAITFELLRSIQERDILIVTPYRGQRKEIRDRLSELGVCKSLVSTVHRAQGSERRVVILDPVKAGARSVNGVEGRRLLNVAMSRAEAQLVVLLPADYRKNSVLLDLVKMFPPHPIDSALIDQALRSDSALKEEVPLLVTPVPPCPPAPHLPLIEQFRDELYRELLNGRFTMEYRKWFSTELALKSRFKTLDPTARHSIISEVLEKLPPLAGTPSQADKKAVRQSRKPKSVRKKPVVRRRMLSRLASIARDHSTGETGRTL